MTPIQQMFLGVGASADKKYVDDCFSTYLYTGTGSGINIVNGLDNTGEGGMVWVKNRGSGSDGHYLVDTVRGNTKNLRSDLDDDQETLTGISSFNNNGFSITSSSMGPFNSAGNQYSTWNWRNSAMFQVVQWTGSGSNRTISHSLGSVPGFMLCKRYSSPDEDWAVYHRSLGNSKTLMLHTNGGVATSSNTWNDTTPTASVLSLGSNARVNTDGEEYIGYLFAGGEEGYNSVDFDGSNDYLNTAHNADYDFGTGDFTIEAWVRYEGSSTASTNDTIIDTRNGTSGGTADDGWIFIVRTNGKIGFHHGNIGWQESTTVLSTNTWYHVAITRNGNDFRVFINGTEESDNSSSGAVNAGDHNFRIGYKVPYSASSLTYWNGKISNLRVVKGTAVYTSSFTAPTAPLTNITNTKLLCCNGDITTSSTVTPGTITASGSPNTTGTSPFTSPDSVFGTEGDQNVVKCGSYIGNASSTGPEIFVGFEPQWILIKNTTGQDWYVYDSMRGIATGEDDVSLKPNSNAAEGATNYIDLTSTGFKIVNAAAAVNGNTHEIVYVAIRRSDGAVGKPIEDATKCFAMDTGAGSSTIPNFDSGFPVDFSLSTDIDSSANWTVGARLLQGKYLESNSTNAEGSWTPMVYDSNAGWNNYDAYGSDKQSWMWKRHAGFDVVTYKGNGTSGLQIPHSLSKTPEMIWVKSRGASSSWQVYQKGLNGGTTPENYRIKLDSTDAELSVSSIWNNSAPSATHFTIGNDGAVNQSGIDFVAMLFASVDGISKCGYFTGDGTSDRVITTGFQPRFLIIRPVNITENWMVLDTTRGWGSGNDQYLKLDTTAAQAAYDFGAPTSTGFNMGDGAAINVDTAKYIYYAHA